VSQANNFGTKYKAILSGMDFSVNGNASTSNLFLVDEPVTMTWFRSHDPDLPSIEVIAQFNGPEYVKEESTRKGRDSPLFKASEPFKDKKGTSGRAWVYSVGNSGCQSGNNPGLCNLSISSHFTAYYHLFYRFPAPFNAQSVQDEFISERQPPAVHDQPIGITNNGVARDTPRLMTSDPGTMITD